MGMASAIIKALGGTPMAVQDVEKLKIQLREALEENGSLVNERAGLLERIDSLESGSDVSEKELQYLRSIVNYSRLLSSFLTDKSYQAAVLKLTAAIQNAQEENML